jgi:hypothetical protein
MTLLDRVTTHLRDAGVAHALIGAAALAAAGIARSTFDIDLLSTDQRVLHDTFWDALRRQGAGIDCRRGDRDDPLAGVVRLDEAGQRPVDVVVGRLAWQARAVQRATPLPAGAPVVRPSDLVLLKLYAGGSQDLWDIRELLTTPDAAAVAAAVDADLPALPAFMRQRWASLR